jgi:hypothetical protein
MPTAIVLNDALSPVDRAAVDAILKQHGYEPVYSTPDDLSKLNPASDIGVVCLPVDIGEQAAVDDKIKKFAAAGIRVVGIWLHAQEGVTLPAGLKKFGFSAVGLSSPKLPDVLAGEVQWEEPSGQKRPTQNVPRNKC